MQGVADNNSNNEPLKTPDNKEEEIFAKLNDIAKHLAEYTKAETYSDDDISKLYEDLKDIKEEVERLSEKYHELDKVNSDFLGRLDTLEKTLAEYKAGDIADEDKVKTAVSAFMSLLLGGAVTYVFSQMRQW